MRKVIALFALLCTSFGSFAEDFKTIPLSKAFLPSQATSSQDHTLPFLFTIPTNFVKRDAPEQETVLWGTADDIETVLTSKNLTKTKNGIYTLKISLNVGYDKQTMKFSGEEQIADMNKQLGFSEVKFQKTYIKGFPMATLTAVKDDRHLFLHYIALGNVTLLINYFHPETFSPRDSEIWSRFIDGLKN